MLIIAACVVVFVSGLVAIARWGGCVVTPPDRTDAAGRMSVGDVVRRYMWWVTVAAVGGIGAGLVTGVGGRLIMRLLAATSPEARGRITEADEVVGVISVGGSFGLILFSGVGFGVLTVIIYLLIRPWLASGRLGGFCFGLLLLLLASTRVEPLRPDNFDFSLVGPGWLALTTFGLLVVLHGMLVAALVGRYSNSLPLLASAPDTNDRRIVALYLPLVLVVVLIPVAIFALAVGIVVVLGSRLIPSTTWWRSSRVVLAGRVLLVVAALVALPSFVSAANTILSAS